MLSDKTRKYHLADSKTEFIHEFKGQNELNKKFMFGEVMFVKDGNEIHAFKNKCPHQGARLNGCSIHDGKVVCPVHKYGFDLENGRGHGMYLDIYDLEEKEDGFYLLRTYFSWFGE
ncbi:MAG: Rieske (2Fe-2S) protein [Brumimicrobium sp.]